MKRTQTAEKPSVFFSISGTKVLLKLFSEYFIIALDNLFRHLKIG